MISRFRYSLQRLLSLVVLPGVLFRPKSTESPVEPNKSWQAPTGILFHKVNGRPANMPKEMSGTPGNTLSYGVFNMKQRVLEGFYSGDASII